MWSLQRLTPSPLNQPPSQTINVFTHKLKKPNLKETKKSFANLKKRKGTKNTHFSLHAFAVFKPKIYFLVARL